MTLSTTTTTEPTTKRRRSSLPKVRRHGNRWGASVRVNDPATGQSKFVWVSGKTEREAKNAVADLVSKRASGTYAAPSKQTLAAFLDEWLAGIRSTVRPTTFAFYRRMAETHISPRLGGTPLRQLGPAQLNALYADLAESGRLDGKGGLSPASIRRVHVTFHKALRDAVRWGKLSRNPADLADPPQERRPEMRVWSAEQARAFLAHVKGDRLAALYLLALTTGMRRGEVLGLRWADVDLDAPRLAIRETLVDVGYEARFSTPKTAKGRRVVALDPATVVALRAHRVAQLEERMAWGPAYEDTGLVFTREDGHLFHPQTLTKAFRRHVRESGLPAIPFHGLRHTYATAALAGGVDTRIVSDRLGHAQTSITADLYQHVFPEMDQAAADKVAGLILGN